MQLIFPDERQPVTKTSEVTKKVTELLRLDQRVQQIAMIAQGDFQKLSTEQRIRSEIFRKNVSHRDLSELQKRLRKQQRSAGKYTMKKKRSISQYLDNVVCPEEAE